MSGVAQDDAFVDRVSANVLAAVQAALRAELDELRSLSQEVPGLVVRTRELGQFVDGLNPEAANPVVRRQEQHGAAAAYPAGSSSTACR